MNELPEKPSLDFSLVAAVKACDDWWKTKIQAEGDVYPMHELVRVAWVDGACWANDRAPHHQSELKPWQERLIAEESQLRGRLARLNAFICGPTFDALPEDERRILAVQQGAMQLYLFSLEERIEKPFRGDL